MPKYSNGANILGKTNLYAKIKNIDAQPPKIPVIINSIQCVKFIILSYSVEKRNITRSVDNSYKLSEWKYETLDEAKRISGILKKRIIEGFNESK